MAKRKSWPPDWRDGRRKIVLPYQAKPPKDCDGALQDTIAFLRWRFEHPVQSYAATLKFMATHLGLDRDFLRRHAEHDPAVWDAAYAAAQQSVAAGEIVPEPLRPILRGELPRPKKRGPHPYAARFRDRMIATAVRRLLDDWPVPARGRPGKGQRPSAFKIVRDALASDELGEHKQVLTQRAIVKIYGKFPRLHSRFADFR